MTTAELQKKADELRKTLAKIDALTGKKSARAKDAERHAAKRAPTRDVPLLAPADLARRRACLADPLVFMAAYFGWIFTQPFVPSRVAMTEAIVHAARYGGDYAVADQRGSGKSGISLFTAFWLGLRGEIQLPLIVGKNQRGAEIELDNLKRAIVEAPNFAADFPEVCLPIIALDDWASSARKQTVGGDHRTKIGWEKDCLFLPTVPQAALPADWPADEPSVARGQGLAVVGIDGKIRGFKRRNIRPDGVIFDDIDDRESARSQTQTADHCMAIDQDAIGVAGSGKRAFRVMLCTTINDQCAAAIYTAKPAWRGQRFAAIAKMPEREDLRDEYIDKRKGRTADDPDARVAHRFYLDNRAEIERGGEVGNPYDFNGKEDEHGEPLEVSALQHYYNLIADIGWDAFRCEYQNDPPPLEETISKAGISRQLVQSRLSGLNRRQLPPECKIALGIDLGKTYCHWVAGAFRTASSTPIVDYGIIEVHGTEGTEKKEVIDLAILRALVDWKDQLMAKPFCDDRGNPVPVTCALIDSGYHPDAAYEFVTRFGEPWRACKGSSKFHHGAPSRTRRVGNHWFAQPYFEHKLRPWVYSLDPDYFKRAVHDRFVADPFDENNRPRPGALTLFVPVGRRDHHTFASHIMAKEWITEFHAKKGEWSHWAKHSGNDHLFDATAMMLAAADMGGFRLIFDTRAPKPPMTLAAMAAAARK